MPKKILYIVNSLYQTDYMSQLTSNKINWMADNSGYDIYLLLTESEKRKKAIVELSPKVHVKNLGLNYHELDNRFFLWKLFGKWNRQRKYKWALKRLLKKEKPEIIVSLLGHEIEFMHNIRTKGDVFAEFHEKVALYSEVTNTSICKYKYIRKAINFILQRRLSYRMRRMKAFVVDTNEASHKWKSILKDVRVIHNPILNPVEEIIDKKDKIVLAIGDFNPSSRYELLIEAWRRIIPRYSEWRLRLYGKGDIGPYKQLIKNHRLSRTVYCYALDNDMRSIYERTSIFVHTLSDDLYGQRIMETQSYGIPCIAFDTPNGPKDLIKNEINGFLLFDKHTTDLSCKLGLLMRNTELRYKMAMNTLKENEPFLIEHIMKQWISLFETTK